MPRILIVDDEFDIRLLLRSILESYGYECEEAQNGLEALEKLEEKEFGVILLDYQMPYLNGLQVIQALSAKPRLSIPSIIMMTASPTEDLCVQAIQAGAEVVLSKPFDLDKMLLAIGRSLKRNPAQGCLKGPP